MNVKVLAAMAGMLFFSCSAFAECILSEPPQEERPYKLNLSEAECRLVRYSGGNVVTIFVNYPSMEVVYERAVDDSLVIFRLVYISKATFNQDASVEGRQPVSVRDGIETYGDGSGLFRRFISSDGTPVIVTEWPNSYDARHLFNNEVEARFQYSLKHEDLREMDDFAITVFNKITRE